MAFILIVKQVEKCDHPLAHRRIKAISGTSGEFQWRHTQAEAIGHIEANLFDYFVEKNSANLRLVVGQTLDGEKYLKTMLDNGIPQHLLELPDGSSVEPPSSSPIQSLSYLATLKSGH